MEREGIETLAEFVLSLILHRASLFRQVTPGILRGGRVVRDRPAMGYVVRLMLMVAFLLVVQDRVQPLVQLFRKRLGAFGGRLRGIIRRTETIGRLDPALHARIIIPAISTLRGHAQQTRQ